MNNINQFIIKDEGVFFQKSADQEEGRNQLVFICSKLEILAKTRNDKSENWGRLLRFEDDDNVLHEISIPMSMLASDGADLRKLLQSQGLRISCTSTARQKLMSYIQDTYVELKAFSTNRIGWHKGTFVLPHKTYGSNLDTKTYLQLEGDLVSKIATSGNLDDWKNNVASYCDGNSKLIFSVSLAFAPPLLEPMEAEGGGFHLRGSSSTGKTTSLYVAGSVWGGGKNGFLQSWRTTSNGLEGISYSHCDGFLALDELSQIRPEEAGEVAYMLANGTGKGRANKRGDARSRYEWTLLFLSSGETSLSTHMLQAKKISMAGQETRLVEIPIDCRKGYGAFETLHHQNSPDEFSKLLKMNAKKFYGTAIDAFLTKLTKSTEEMVQLAKKFEADFIKSCLPLNSSGEVSRVISRFGLVAAAGELAIHMGIVPWPKDSAVNASKNCFQDWLETRGGIHSIEELRAIEQIRAFLQKYGSSMFIEINSDNTIRSNPHTAEHAGYKKALGGGKFEWLIFPQTFKDICQNLDPTLSANTLASRGYLRKDGSGKNSVAIRIGSISEKQRFYCIHSSILGEGDNKGVLGVVECSKEETFNTFQDIAPSNLSLK